MADVTTPFGFPYPESTDLVRDGATDIEALAQAVNDALVNQPIPAGIGSNVVQTVKTDTFATTSATYETVTGFTVTITPTSADSKVLVVCGGVLGVGGREGAMVQVSGGNLAFVGDADGDRVRAAFGQGDGSSNNWQNPEGLFGFSIVALDSPNTTSPVTYSVQMRRGFSGATAFLNRSAEDRDTERNPRTASSITVIEVAS